MASIHICYITHESWLQQLRYDKLNVHLLYDGCGACIEAESWKEYCTYRGPDNSPRVEENKAGNILTHMKDWRGFTSRGGADNRTILNDDK